ncbi:AAA family ATPase [Mycobacteroides franklinii]|uniref:Adenylate kinase n=1 Tax=Mycobacteroides franklinii TaxID=948102 RepID=A0A4R8R163_9MYCO|nr:AAA family ATPase [Mycobacteroides franklinii]TDZ45199.1 adenylate kinase [Mycobacteroides franklinii]TDZ48690.1 adenylate kinase [Mycobacteroides franklinii]TDZ58871.1 adenylate kinase [Mycobacteroides franklinii]TDZ66385.1 adenylate kinase [Mycobacteroides franklinii]TDZ72308.1 adenylate kinase [Mycobacteroides franklinii]
MHHLYYRGSPDSAEEAFVPVLGKESTLAAVKESQCLDICGVADEHGAVDANQLGAHCGAAPQIHETHTGIVILIGSRAYKVKKAVTTDFLDFSTVELRERACNREVFLNRRLARDSYLGVAHLTDPAGGSSEPVIVMRRYPDSARLATMVRTGVDVEPNLAAIAEALAVFHAAADRGAPISESGTANAVSARWEENLTVLAGFVGSVLTDQTLHEIRSLSNEFMRGRHPLFAERIEKGLIVDGHGDLMAEDIFCVPGGAVLLDCLEFDDHLRYVDCADDAAFLAMDLASLGRDDLAEYFIDQYTQSSAIDTPQSLWHFYVAYRAVVRAKVDCIRFTQGRPASADAAIAHLELAHRYLRAGAVRLIRIGGGPGTGKTTLAKALSERTGAQVISTDAVRRELQEQGVIAGEPGILDGGLYSTQNVAAVYETVLQRARKLLAWGQSVILDGTWRDPHQQERTRDLACQTHAVLHEFECHVPLSLTQNRIAHRGPTLSDATSDIAAALDVTARTSDTVLRIDTNRPVAESVAQIEAAFRLS